MVCFVKNPLVETYPNFSSLFYVEKSSGEAAARQP